MIAIREKHRMRESAGDRVFNICNILLLSILILLMLYPLYFTVIASVSEPYKVVSGQVYALPNGFTLEAYQNVFRDNRVWSGYKNSLIYTICGTLLNLCLTIPTAYAWSKKDLFGRSALAVFLLIPMYFGGGLMPTYLQIKSLGLINKPYTLIILGGISIYNTILTRVYFQNSIPESLYESATIDGASEWINFWRIALPLAKPIIAVIALYYAVSRWNEYYNALIYVSKADYFPLQMQLRNILLLNQSMAEISVDSMDAAEFAEFERRQYMAMSMKYSLIFIASAPLLIAYPFVQKFFVKGVMIGSLKG